MEVNIVKHLKIVNGTKKYKYLKLEYQLVHFTLSLFRFRRIV